MELDLPSLRCEQGELLPFWDIFLEGLIKILELMYRRANVGLRTAVLKFMTSGCEGCRLLWN